MVNEKSPNQATKTISQRYQIDINQIYKDWITPIDLIRSRASLSSFSAIVSRFAFDFTSFYQEIEAEKTAQESRCHAFYRLIGFPVVAADNKEFYSPGLDFFKCEGREIINEKKGEIAGITKDNYKDPLLNTLSNSREKFVEENLKKFSIPNSIQAGTLALSSGGTKELRKFSSPFEKEKGDDPFDVNVDNQTYNVNTSGLVGGNDSLTLGAYKDVGGNRLPEADFNNLKSRRHIIRPFVVDARIDLTVTPQSNLVAAPFMPDDTYLKVSSTESVKRPLIEKIIRDLQPINAKIDARGSHFNKVQEYIDSSPYITDNVLIKNLADTKTYNQVVQAQFIDSIDIMMTMVDTLVNAQEYIAKIQSLYYWLPSPSVNGPESGSSVQPVFIQQKTEAESTIELSLLTTIDNEILISYAKGVHNASKPTSAISSDSIPKVDFSPGTTAGMGDNNVQNFESLVETRNRELSQANTYLQTIEIIMGEFSGLGLCDIVAIVGALKILPLKNLYGLLDNDAWSRAKTALTLSTAISTIGTAAPPPERAEFTESMKAYTSLVKDMYNLMDSLYKIRKNGKFD